jgi:hypothetical protein
MISSSVLEVRGYTGTQSTSLTLLLLPITSLTLTKTPFQSQICFDSQNSVKALTLTVKEYRLTLCNRRDELGRVQELSQHEHISVEARTALFSQKQCVTNTHEV